VISRWTKVRMALFGVVLVGLGAGVLRKAVQVQVQEAELLKEWADRQNIKDIRVPPRRGRIRDRNGDELATSVEVDSVSCNPRQLRHVPDGARRLARALGMKQADVEAIVEQDKVFAWVRRRITAEQATAVRALNLAGLNLTKEPKRVYPKGALAATVIGHASIDGEGIEGVERAYDRYLHGTSVQATGLRDSYGRELLTSGIIDTSAAAGADLVLTLDKWLTFVTEKALAEAVEKHHAKDGVALIMDPQTGELLALANLPSYDPASPGEGLKLGARNRAITDPYEPGSTLKSFTFATALETGKITPNTLIDCQGGVMKIGKHTIHDDRHDHFGTIPASEAFKHSSNIGTVKVARRLGSKEALYDMLVRFGFGRPTGIGLQGEVRGTLGNVQHWGEIEFATHAYGHGVTVTPLQIVTAYAAIASGGVYHAPRIVSRIVRPDGHDEALPPQPPPLRLISEQTARTMLKLMEGVVEGGTGKLAALDGYPVGGKTGTAAKVVGGHYDYNKNFASFVGVVPSDRPRLVIAVMIDEPQPIHYGGQVAAPVFKVIAEQALRYLGVPPTLPIVAKGKDRKVEIADVAEGPGTDVPVGVEDIAETADETTAQAHGAEEARPETVVVPSFAGLTMAEAIRVARRAGVEIVPEGSGVAFTQTPAPGPLPRGTACRVSFRPGG
jgi:cell division protein FtsI (penicillin-binding protein 3)